VTICADVRRPGFDACGFPEFFLAVVPSAGESTFISAASPFSVVSAHGSTGQTSGTMQLKLKKTHSQSSRPQSSFGALLAHGASVAT
jgi:hypothetical protein